MTAMIRSLRASALLLAAAIVPAAAGQFVPVPAVVIYPGDVIRDSMRELAPR